MPPEHDAPLSLGPKRNLIMPIGVIIALMFFTMTSTLFVSEKYHTFKDVDNDLATKLTTLTENVSKQTTTVNKVHDIVTAHEGRIKMLEHKTNTSPKP